MGTKSNLDKLAEATALMSSITREEAEEVPEQTLEQLISIAMAMVAFDLNTTILSLAAVLTQAYILGQRSATSPDIKLGEIE